ncbi:MULTISPECIES: metal ABC transporter solute-binding protein, Zn/Mn family [unclassified Arthrobacter]|uniref:metal ABC transporter solute-binding protein, Zn/Mn family n=1 Tax=unclassified Arthrobacter TaxID=235627 RepID=UPI001490C89D|nr:MULTISPECIES: zinc ABC transporter substrate-binding protein [unclassified Arthrobacter]MBE0008609.1 ABC transporter substrate-binding protein [Arthrobacter sp. AET 35A]NOJ58620.1 zinc ABC transporter solute-binding protein [Arthrobacter sp. 260]NOJ62443.1 zinc ABC transporter solute-binding protein [Arthrobacter sp. 147(2020)]
MRRLSTSTAFVGVAAAALALTGCGQSGDPAAADSSAEGIQVVSSTNVYGDIAETIGGEFVTVTSIVNSLSQDPHSYEATVQDKLAVSEAELLIENGGGYDPFLHQLADEVEMDHDYIVSAVAVSGYEESEEEHADHADESGDHAEDDHSDHSHGSVNEHVWYDLAAMATVAEDIGSKLSSLDPDNAETYQSNVEDFTTGISALTDRLADLSSTADGQTVAITEPVPVYLLEAAGLQNVTPEGYSEAIEEGSDVSVAVLNDMMNLMEDESLAFLAYNEQTESPQTQTVRDAADAAGVPIVNFTETVPDGEDFLSWMTANVDGIESILAP